MKWVILLLLCCLPVTVLFSQSYVDPLQIRYTHAFRSSGDSRGTPFYHLWIGSDLPIKLKANTYVLISPYFEKWSIDSAIIHHIIPSVKSLTLPVSLLFPWNNTWSVSITPVIRTNGEDLFGEKTFQFGGAGFFSYAKEKDKNIRIGAYMNSDFFGFFFMPLIGADWKMDDHNYFFGLLPGRFTWEHKLNSYLYTGITFRAITNSYRLNTKEYIRIEDNQLSAYLDLYPAKGVCLTIEPGYGIIRKLRTGIEKHEYTNTGKWGDGFFTKISAAYRIRFADRK